MEKNLIISTKYKLGARESNPRQSSRRTFTKALGTGLIAGGSLATTSTTVLVDDRVIDPDEWVPPNPDVPTYEFGADMKELGLFRELVTSKKRSLRQHVENADATTARKEYALEVLKDLCATYPVRRTQQGNTIRIELTPAADDPSTFDSRSKDIYRTAMLVNQGVAELGPLGDVNTQWTPANHGDLAAFCAERLNEYYGGIDIASSHVDILRNRAGDPDEFDADAPYENEYPDYIKKYLDNLVQSEKHYHNPTNYPSTGTAPESTENEYNTALDRYGGGLTDNAFEYLAYATHYMADLGVPLHTGKEKTQLEDFLTYGGNCIHYNYEGYVNEWYAGFFDDNMDNDYRYDINDAPRPRRTSLTPPTTI